jgi:hypothetical protein
MGSTVWEDMNAPATLLVMGDAKPWGGAADIGVITGARVKSVKVSSGADFDSAEIVFPEKAFGEEQNIFRPIRIVSVSGSGRDALMTTIFRGFVNINRGTLDGSTEEMSVTCQDYKWYLSKRTSIRGRLYAVEGASSSPDLIGSGVSLGDIKYTFEKYRAHIRDKTGYLQNEPCVFNKNGIPDCFTENYSSTMCVFFYPEISNEDDGLASDAFNAKAWNGKYWSWATILAHIEKYWIEPYTLVQTGIKINRNDLVKIAGLRGEQPQNFSLENMNVCSAIDTVVQSLPGRWIWYLDYSQPKVKIRIKQIAEGTINQVFLKVPETAEKIATSGANVSSINVQRDGTNSVAYAIAKGGAVRMVSTVRLVPLWQRFNGYDFENRADYEAWRKWAIAKYYTNESSTTDQSVDQTDAVDVLRYERIYRYYGIAIEGGLFADQIVSTTKDKTTLPLSGILGSEYASYENDLKKWWLKSARIKRDINDPGFAGYKKPIIFMFDERRNDRKFQRRDVNGNSVIVPRIASAEATADDLNKLGNSLSWIFPSDGEYSFDESTGVVVFDKPQFKRESPIGAGLTDKKEGDNHIASCMTKYSYDGQEYARIKMEPRDVYLTASFKTDVAAIVGRKIPTGLINQQSGAEFPAYLNDDSSDIIIHTNAWYPVDSEKNKVEAIPTFDTSTMDDHQLGYYVRHCASFPQYKAYMGMSIAELLRQLIAFLEGYSRLSETVEANVPYLWIGPSLGDRIRKIHGTKYTDLTSALVSISWSVLNDSDSFGTQLSFSNAYIKQKNNQDSAKTQEDEKQVELDNDRDTYVVEDPELPDEPEEPVEEPNEEGEGETE